MHEIKINADSLAALLHAQKEKPVSFDKQMNESQAIFEQEMLKKRLFWKKEQDDLSCYIKNPLINLKKREIVKKRNMSINVI